MGFGKAANVNPFMQAAMNYKSAYRELYEIKSSSINNLKIEDPGWLYKNKNPDQYDQAKAEFKREVRYCASNPECTTSVSEIASKIVKGYSKISSISLIKAETQNTGGYIGTRGWDPVLGVWVHLLRVELGYAASHVSPLVFDLMGDGIKLKRVYFDIDNDGFAEKVGWLSGEDGQLARDLNRNGQIDDGDDLISAYYKLSLVDSNSD